MKADPQAPLRTNLTTLQLPYIREHYEQMAKQAADQHHSHIEYLARLVEGEAHRRENRSIERRVKAARFPMLKSLDQFQWNWPRKINRPQIQNLFRLTFIEAHANAIFLGGVGLGKSHFAIALGHAACLQGYSALFTTAVDIINTLAAAQVNGGLKREMTKYLKPRVLIIDELGYLPIDKFGADLLFQIFSQRYERGSTVVTTNKLCGAPHKRFNAASIVMRTLVSESPGFPLS